MSNLRLREVKWFSQSRGRRRMGGFKAGSAQDRTGYSTRTCVGQRSHSPCFPPCPPEPSWQCIWWLPASESSYLLPGLLLRRPPYKERELLRWRSGTSASSLFSISLWVTWPPLDQRGGMSLLLPALIQPWCHHMTQAWSIRVVYPLAIVIWSCDTKPGYWHFENEGLSLAKMEAWS